MLFIYIDACFISKRTSSNACIFLLFLKKFNLKNVCVCVPVLVIILKIKQLCIIVFTFLKNEAEYLEIYRNIYIYVSFNVSFFCSILIIDNFFFIIGFCIRMNVNYDLFVLYFLFSSPACFFSLICFASLLYFCIVCDAYRFEYDQFPISTKKIIIIILQEH